MDFKNLRLYRPATIDLILTKMMRDDPIDLEDVNFVSSTLFMGIVGCSQAQVGDERRTEGLQPRQRGSLLCHKAFIHRHLYRVIGASMLREDPAFVSQRRPSGLGGLGIPTRNVEEPQIKTVGQQKSLPMSGAGRVLTDC